MRSKTVSALLALVTAITAAPDPARAEGAPSEVDRTIGRMRETSRSVRELLRTARKRGTKQQVACVDEALSRVDVAARAAREQALELRAAEQRADGDGAHAARQQIARLAEAVRLASAGARKCMPPPAPPPKVLLGTVVKVSVDPSIPPVLEASR
jgi:hypothetical protein